MPFDWDQANTDHIARHRVTPSEAEQDISGASPPVETEDRSGEERHTELGQTDTGRVLVVTAFRASGKWRTLWRRVKGVEDA
jgi:uncharacterized DUF497 family protein